VVRFRVGPAKCSRIRRACWPASTSKGLKVCVWINPYIAQQRSPLFDEGCGEGLPAEAPGRGACGSGTCGRPAWRSSTSPTRPPRQWYRASCAACCAGRGLLQDRLRRAHPHRRGLARRLRPATHAQLLRLSLQQGRVRDCCRRSAARARPACSRARHAWAGSSSRCTGAATATPPMSRWPRACAAG
jgi:alpha-D-xyloside xylohydrolase